MLSSSSSFVFVCFLWSSSTSLLHVQELCPLRSAFLLLLLLDSLSPAEPIVHVTSALLEPGFDSGADRTFTHRRIGVLLFFLAVYPAQASQLRRLGTSRCLALCSDVFCGLGLHCALCIVHCELRVASVVVGCGLSSGICFGLCCVEVFSFVLCYRLKQLSQPNIHQHDCNNYSM